MARVLKNKNTTISIVLEDGAGDLITDVEPKDVIVHYRKFQGEAQEKDIDSNNFREVDDTKMPGVYEMDFNTDELDTLGEMIVQIRSDVLGDFEPTHLRFEVVEELDEDVILNELDDMHDTMNRMVGLSQENFRITDHEYTGQNKLSEATIELYETSAMETLLATYRIEATYDPQGLMVNYAVMRTDEG